MAEAAPLIATAQAPVPADGDAVWFTGAGGARLRAALFHPPGEARGSVILSGGRTEPIEKYFEVIGELLGRGFVVLAHDWRGQGLSQRGLPDRLKGHAAGYRDFLQDHRALLDAFEARLPRPWLAISHSMGGCLTALILAHGEPRIAGAVLSAPMLGLSAARSVFGARQLAWLAARLGKAGGYVLGQAGAPFSDDFDANVLTHDRARFARSCGQLAACPDLALGGPTWGWLDFAFGAVGWLGRPANAARIAVPLTVVAAGEDRLVDNAGAKALAANVAHGRYVEIPGAYHEILMETDALRAPFWAEFDALAARVIG